MVIIPRSFEQFAEGEDSRGWLVLSLINPASKGVGELRSIAVIYKIRESERLFPEQVDHVLKVIDSFFTESLVLSKRVSFVAPLAFKICANQRGSEFSFAHGDGQAEGKYWINEPVSVPNAEKAFSREATDLVGVVGDDMHLLDQLHLGNTAPDFRINVVKLIAEELLRGLLFLQKVSPRRDHSDADDVLIERDEPSPVELLRIKNQCVVFRVFARSAGASDGAGDLRKKRSDGRSILRNGDDRTERSVLYKKQLSEPLPPCL